MTKHKSLKLLFLPSATQLEIACEYIKNEPALQVGQNLLQVKKVVFVKESLKSHHRVAITASAGPKAAISCAGWPSAARTRP